MLLSILCLLYSFTLGISFRSFFCKRIGLTDDGKFIRGGNHYNLNSETFSLLFWDFAPYPWGGIRGFGSIVELISTPYNSVIHLLGYLGIYLRKFRRIPIQRLELSVEFLEFNPDSLHILYFVKVWSRIPLDSYV